MRLWRTSQPGCPLAQFKHERGVNGAVYCPRTHRVLTRCEDDATTRLWDVSSPERPIAEFKDGMFLIGCAITKDEDRVITWGGGRFKEQDAVRFDYERHGWVHIWDPSHPEFPVKEFTTGPEIRDVVLGPDDHRLLVLTLMGEASLWDRDRSDMPLMKFTPEQRNYVADFGLDGGRILTSNEDKQFRIWDLGTRDGIPVAKRWLEYQIASGTVLNPDGTVRTMRFSEAASAIDRLNKLK